MQGKKRRDKVGAGFAYSLFMTLRLNSKSLFALLPLTVAFVSSPALAAEEGDDDDGITLAAEFGPELVLPPNEDDDYTELGFGAAMRAGYTWDSALIDFTPEAKFGFQSPGRLNSFAMMGGLRINLFEGLSPAAFAHVGGLLGELEGMVWDVGVGLDFTFIPVVDFGIFASYNSVGNATFSSNEVSYESTNWHWMQFGGQVAVHF